MSRFLSVLALSLASAFGSAAHAQAPTTGGSALRPLEEGERLSDWILRQPHDTQHYLTGLMWEVAGEKQAQARLKSDLLAALTSDALKSGPLHPSLIPWVRALPVTGRVHLPMTDARWLQANPDQDPILQSDHAVRVPHRPTTVMVITPENEPCMVNHSAGALAKDYIRACTLGYTETVDRVWVIQPDGLVSDFSIGLWNEQAQSELAPGALVWAPSRRNRISASTSALLAKFLATQSYITVQSSYPTARQVSAPSRPHTLARSQALTANDWGVIGLMQTPSARMSPAGEARFNWSRVPPYERYNVFIQPFAGLEAGFRYTDIRNRMYGPQNLSGDQTYKDKSIDLKIRLLEEGANRPQLALGFIDAGGTGLFSSEYLVGNKRYGAFDWSLGIGWGYLGASANIQNPFSAISPRFNTRGASVSTGGKPNSQAFFRGPAALFGGVQYQSPWEPLVLKAEYDGNHYQNEPLNNNQPRKSPINLGLVYRMSPSVDLSWGLQRGDTMMLGLTLHTSVAQLSTPKPSDHPTPKISAKQPTEWGNLTATASDLRSMSHWGIRGISSRDSVMRVLIEGASGAHWDDRIDRMLAVLHRDAPAKIQFFELVFSEDGVLLSGRMVDREAWVRQKNSLIPPSASTAPVQAFEPKKSVTSEAADTNWSPTPAKFGYALVPSWQQNIGGPDGFLLFRAGVSVPMRWRLSQSTSISGTLSLNLLDNFDNFKYTGPSQLPRVRTYMREYMTTSRLNMPNLQITHLGQLSENQFYSAYAGYLESMYAGVGGEWLYRPWHGPIAFGVDVNRVQQRSFDQLLGFNRAGSQTGYQTNTGHATVYWDTGWQSTQVKLSAGRYLAGDIGATLDLSRSFDNGVTVGVWATKTNVSSQQFGEGSFDKGLYLRIPFDVMTSTRSGNAAQLVYSPLTRDGGARLNRHVSLFNATMARSHRDTSFTPAPALPFGR